jgi:propionyl-CoA carboxylase alpha chain
VSTGIITTLLVANRGEIARRIIRTAREMGIRTVAVYVAADADSPHVHDADDAVLLQGGSYLDRDALVDAALVTGADAVHPGYGFLSENAPFARDVIAAGLVWVGPSPDAISEMGDKLAAKRLATLVGVPTLPMAEDPADAASVGYPLLVKAAAGGGGKGMRVVERPDDLVEAVEAARREALGGFGDERVFLERYIARSRHIEIQILGDAHGNVVHLGERECSIQRRHQKVLEESPSPIVDAGMRAAMGAAAVALAHRLGYQSAGTVEFLVDDAARPDGTHEFWFLEVNTRLQVEHPVTEFVTGLDLVREQLRIAAGEPLGYAQDDITFSGHAIEARLYAEDASAGFLPSTGTLHGFVPATEPAVRWDSGVEQHSVVGTGFDPMLAKVIAHGPSRREAALRLALALEGTHLAGVTTNRDVLVSTLRHPAFLAGDTTTDFFERHTPARSRPLDADGLHRVAAAAALWLQGRHRADARSLTRLPSGWRNGRLPDQHHVFVHHDREIEIRYRSQRDGSFLVDATVTAHIHSWHPHGIDVEIGGRRLHARVTAFNDRIVVHDGSGDVDLRIAPRFILPGSVAAAGSLNAPMPGRVLDVRIAVGDVIAAGQILMILEAMKMEHRITAPADGVVTAIHVTAGDQVELGAALAIVDVAAAVEAETP